MGGRGIIGVGSPIVDLLLQLSEEELSSITADKGSMTMVSGDFQENILQKLNRRPVMTPGGSAGNTMFALARLGARAAMQGTMGLDMYGQFYCQEFCKLGGLLEHFSFTDRLPTARCLSLITPDTERTMFTNLSAAEQMDMPTDFDGYDFVYLEGYVLYNPAWEKLLVAARKSGAKVVFDLGDYRIVELLRDRVTEVLEKYVDVVFANEKEAAAFCGALPPGEQAGFLNEFCATSVIKLGPEGCVVGERGVPGVIRCPAPAVTAVDTTAAGDLFQAGYLYGLLRGCPAGQCASFGAVLGSEVVKVIGTVIPPDRWAVASMKIHGSF